MKLTTERLEQHARHAAAQYVKRQVVREQLADALDIQSVRPRHIGDLFTRRHLHPR
ncbi:unannotated protein [freshwater metagenome]|uniref:Unannotated protein n=1 Tax=freshwater metagenome TaxID=449393 RepID=A0A6J7FFC6_9ZZZZ|nr:hypothetical protein [Actinomycetota bacterium]